MAVITITSVRSPSEPDCMLLCVLVNAQGDTTKHSKAEEEIPPAALFALCSVASPFSRATLSVRRMAGVLSCPNAPQSANVAAFKHTYISGVRTHFSGQIQALFKHV